MERLVDIVGYIVDIYIFLIFIYIILGYFSEVRGSRLYGFLEQVCEPIIRPFEFATIGGISFAPILASLFLKLIHYLLIIIVTL